MNKHMGWTVVRALPELIGKPWCDVTRAYLSTLRPSKVRVITNGIMKSDAVTWRVTVHVSDGVIIDIEQEVEVDLPDGAQHGHDLRCQLDKLRAVP